MRDLTSGANSGRVAIGAKHSSGGRRPVSLAAILMPRRFRGGLPMAGGRVSARPRAGPEPVFTSRAFIPS